MAMGAGMTSAIMNPVALPITQKKIAEKKAEVMSLGIIIPDEMDDEMFVSIFGMGSTKSRPGKEMEAIRAANLLTDNDPHGGAWIKFNKPAGSSSEGTGDSGRSRRRGGRRRS
jgi:5-methyltetrahydrofolate--homocysteine methyltransferase